MKLRRSSNMLMTLGDFINDYPPVTDRDKEVHQHFVNAFNELCLGFAELLDDFRQDISSEK